jgi:hypothetical protein
MQTKRWNLALGLGLILAAALACNFNVSTANISELKVGKDEKVSSQTSNFGPKDTIYGLATISNTSDKHKVRIRLLVDSVDGMKSGDVVPGTEASNVQDGAVIVPLRFTPPPTGWPNGTYKVEFTMFTEDGSKQQDQKTANITVSGGSSSSSSSSSDMSNMNMSNDNKD